jgi:hypothetical protein
MVQLNKSDSTVSLSELPIVDTACHFCRNPEDSESGKALIDARIFLNCECRITVHIHCWREYIDEYTGTPECPSCDKIIPAWKQSGDASSISGVQEYNKKNYVREIAIGFFILMFTCSIAFAIIYLQK